ncbi:hypothetical protein IFM61392_06747 [Aspergillus lentulus]|uniref:Ryanodine receptor Ryr domain-containing protein n=1 Tax=Aspergillus lentulus TaxID=293939 RepID=A0AAN5YYY3_ASPLE|nr:hypothetical protein CNMCM6069_009438 [Aspergillus lentulus]KAF4208761.1 hypothetical protein CNMCM8927_008710 [Aspergillus lentulus]GFF74879.1 hypothetical protein IFM62136_08934 [Aspergillus lentulus]GFF92536.1 hypothetical protein IFM60648_09782 [Aspergillus lentulus]GFG11121.1 hypothetical protein IFM61392_06747 [Aspergillus lentulus]
MTRLIVVAGDSPRDLLLYPAQSSVTQHGRQTSMTHEVDRGARLITHLLETAVDKTTHAVHGPAPYATTEDHLHLNSITELELVSGKDGRLFRVKHAQATFTPPVWHPPAIVPTKDDRVAAMVLQDADAEFTNCGDAVDFLQLLHAETVIYRMVSPLGRGRVWDAVRPLPMPDGYGGRKLPADKMIVVVSAEDLRADGVELCYSTSWEKICEDFVENLGSNGQLDTLVTCAHLIVLLGCDGVIYHRGRQMTEPILFFDPRSEEGSFERCHGGHMPGVVEVFVANLTAEIVQSSDGSSIEGAIRRGLLGARRFTELKYRNSQADDRPKYPISEVMGRYKDPGSDGGNLITMSIPAESISQGKTGGWSILQQNVGDPVLMAHHIVIDGVLSAANWIPIARFGELTVMDRAEIEAYRAIFNAIIMYMSSEQTKPLNLGIFGARGSGKSFAAVQVATSAAAVCGREVQQFKIHLSRASKVEDLVNTLNAVRDSTLSGRLPLVYLDGFDGHHADVPVGWLDYLLPPLLTGRFLDRGEMRHTGPAIFLLSSNTARRLDDLRNESFRETYGERSTTKMQDLVSCLHGYVDIRGFDRLDETDTLYPVRRAIALRHILEQRAPALQASGKMSIDESVLDGLLLTPTYRNGYRSLISIITMSNLSGKHHFERASLPSEGQLGLHLDYATFARCAQYNMLSDEVCNSIAKRLHETYVAHRVLMAETQQERRDLESQRSLNSWDFLDEEFKESARAHAADIPRKLRLIRCFMSKTENHRSPVTELDPHELELLAEREHERWNAERLRKQWRLGERDEKQRTSPFLVPWMDLAERWKDIDRVMVGAYPNILPDGYAVYRAGLQT